MDPDSILIKLAILALLIACNALFAMSEMAIITFNDSKLKKMAEEGNLKAQALLKMVREPSKFLSTIQVGVTFSGFLASAAAANQFSAPLANTLNQLLPMIPLITLQGFSLFLITLVLAYVTLVLGELVPKRIAMSSPEKISLAVAPVILFLFKVEKPFVSVLSVSTNLILLLFGIDPTHKPDQVTEEEIRMMVDVGNEEGTIEQAEKEMIDNIFEFDDITAEDVMTHRTEIAAVENTCTVTDVVKLAISQGYSRIPVYKEDIDDIIGIVYAKDMLRFIGSHGIENRSIEPFVREVIFVPESNRCTDLFKTFKDKKIQMAVVVDEYGGTSGIVSMEDLLEAIVGNMQDEYDNEEEEFYQISDTVYTLDGSMSIEDVEKVLDTDIGNDEDYDTLGGLITDILDRIPGEDEHPCLRIRNVELTVLKVEDRRIAKVKAEILPPESGCEAE